jgi:multidrug efflux pump subunit AcrA (membrane-fusion protein)
MIVEILTQVGEWVEPGAPVLRMVYLDRLRVEGFVDAARASNDLVGQVVDISIQLGDEQTHATKGKLTFVSPEVHPVNGMVRVWAEIDNEQGLFRPGLQATMKLKL